MEPEPELSDGAVRLRRWRPDDAAALYHAVHDSLDHLAPFMPWAAAGYSEADSVEFLTKTQQEWRDGVAYDYANVTEDDEILGACGLMSRIGNGGLEIGYWIGKPYAGRGLVTRAAALLTAEAFRIGANRVEIRHDEANERSGLIPRRLGFTRVGGAPAELPGGTASTGVHVHWRLDAP
ncbi:GNAT family N-acetyltransferase [Amycolatopsis acidiphila]|uniref:GNAT family N-acetyltransferase n=1 Tax=Amycolatopsis acidiphila TaxID=715473 RepID=A0A558A1D9_9PSEU|nr:GNAT family N-acetyltransferase [Amycolatopsis acidiphila]TVT18072.1 GNAT family N-acetyltransferase [Amycolatopsis acidiphila]UIJ56644.1 GNAT family N-acetyltransferase [Amycolatopsis acidiphila]GHG56035.1 N-acetyltransferase [Amycolatopsis acidiphila]